jgi:tripartite-type tricarboxylate transporter receptor subunit TctC
MTALKRLIEVIPGNIAARVLKGSTMKLPRRRFLQLAASAAAMPALAHVAGAQTYPSRPITLIAPWPAGGAIDTLCRAIGPGLSDRLGKPVVIDNRPGAASLIGTTAGIRAPPDGHTLTMGGSGSLAIAVTLHTKLAYDPIKDVVPIALAGRIPFVLLVNPSLPVQSLAELIKYAKNNPGKLSYGSGGLGSLHCQRAGQTAVDLAGHRSSIGDRRGHLA